MTWELVQYTAWLVFAVGSITYVIRTHKLLRINSEALRLMAESSRSLHEILNKRPQRVTLSNGKYYETVVVLLDDARATLKLSQEDLRKPSSGDLIALNAYVKRLEEFNGELVHKVGYTLAPAGDDPVSLKRMEYHPLARWVL